MVCIFFWQRLTILINKIKTILVLIEKGVSFDFGLVDLLILKQNIIILFLIWFSGDFEDVFIIINFYVRE